MLPQSVRSRRAHFFGTTLIAALLTVTLPAPPANAFDDPGPAAMTTTGQDADSSGPREESGPTAGELRARIDNCETQISDGQYAHDAGGDPSVDVCGSGGAVFWTADMDIDCDGQRTEECNENTDPWFQPDTAFHQSDGQPLNSAELPHIVVPLPSSIWDYRDSGVEGATVGAVVYADRVVYAVVGDLGPDSAIGEGSYALAEALGIDPDPATGGVSGAVVSYILFPGVTAEPIEDHTDATAKGEQAAQDFVDGVQGCSTINLDFTSYPLLVEGIRGDEVKAAQCLLGNAGHRPNHWPPSGRVGRATIAAIEAFQVDAGLPVTGEVGARTWTALLSFGDTPTLREGSYGTAVKRLQRALNAANDAVLDVDGDFGPLTDEAVRDYQSSRDLTVDGVVGRQTWSALQSGR